MPRLFLGGDTGRRVGRAVRQTEGAYKNEPASMLTQRTPRSPTVNLVQVCGAAVLSDSGLHLYPAQVRIFDDATELWADANEAWALEVSDTALSDGYYSGRLVGALKDKPVYAISLSSDRFLARVTNNSPVGYYSFEEWEELDDGTVQKRDGGRTGQADAVEVNGNWEVPVGAMVWMRGRRARCGSSSSSSSSSSRAGVRFSFDCPDTAQIALPLSSAPDANGYYDAVLEVFDDATKTFVAGEHIWLKDANA